MRFFPRDTGEIVTLTALQKHFVDFFFEFAWEFCIEKWRGFFGEEFSGLRFPRSEARKILEKFGENSEQNSGQNPGRKFQKFGKLSFCNFSDLTIRERKLNPNFFFSNFSGTPGISRQNPGISRQKSLISLVSRGIPNFSAPTPSCGRPPPHPKKSGPKSLGLGSFFVPSDLRNSHSGRSASQWPFSLYRVGKINCMSQEVEDWGSLISVP